MKENNKQKIKVSIIITNYNYSMFLDQTIQNCIKQTYKNIEIIVVDDGSTDNSREIIDKYSNIVDKIYQKNKGMIAASNNGFKASSGDIILFLDADDYIYDYAIEKVVDKWAIGVSKVHFRLQNIDSLGNKKNFTPSRKINLASGDVSKEILKYGTYVTPPTSGNVYSRESLNNLFPILDAKIGDGDSYYDFIPTDSYLKLRIPFYGSVVAINEPLGVYRIHGQNMGVSKTPYSSLKKRQRSLMLSKLNSDFILKYCKNKTWDKNNLFKKNKMMIIRILSLRFDGNKHPFNNDNKFNLFVKVFFNLFHSTKDSKIRRLYNFFVNILLLILPEKLSFSLLKKIHPKSFNFFNVTN